MLRELCLNTHVGIKPKHPNSANRKWVRVQFTKHGKRITVPVPKDGCLNFTEQNDGVLVAGFGQKGHAIGNDTPGVLFKAVQVANVSLLAQHKGKETKILHFDDGNMVINSHILKNKSKTRGQRALGLVVLQGGLRSPRKQRGAEVMVFGERFKVELKC